MTTIMSVVVSRKAMAWMSVLMALAAEFIGLAVLLRSPVPAVLLVISAAVFFLAGCEAWSAPSAEEGPGSEAENLRLRGHKIVTSARVGATGIAISVVLLIGLLVVTRTEMVAATLSLGMMVLLLALYAYPKAYPATSPEAPSEPYIESLPAPDDGGAVPEPDIARLVLLKKSLPHR
jgi:hypothetical protein